MIQGWSVVVTGALMTDRVLFHGGHWPEVHITLLLCHTFMPHLTVGRPCRLKQTCKGESPPLLADALPQPSQAPRSCPCQLRNVIYGYSPDSVADIALPTQIRGRHCLSW